MIGYDFARESRDVLEPLFDLLYPALLLSCHSHSRPCVTSVATVCRMRGNADATARAVTRSPCTTNYTSTSPAGLLQLRRPRLFGALRWSSCSWARRRWAVSRLLVFGPARPRPRPPRSRPPRWHSASRRTAREVARAAAAAPRRRGPWASGLASWPAGWRRPPPGRHLRYTRHAVRAARTRLARVWRTYSGVQPRGRLPCASGARGTAGRHEYPARTARLRHGACQRTPPPLPLPRPPRPLPMPLPSRATSSSTITWGVRVRCTHAVDEAC